MNKRIVMIPAFVIMLAVLPVSPAMAETVTLQQCLSTAVTHNKQLKVSEFEVDIRENKRKSIRGHYLPVIQVDGKVIKFNDRVDLKVDLSFLGTLLADFEMFLSDEAKASLGVITQEGIKLNVREDLVYEGGVTVAQPLGSCLPVFSGERAAHSLTESARADTISARRKLELDVVRAYIGLVAATSIEDTVEAALRQLDAMETQVEGYLKAELVERNALLKVQVAKAEYQRNLFAAQKGADIARAALNMYMGRSLDAPLEPDAEDLGIDVVVNGEVDLMRQQSEALKLRPELLSARHSRKAAKFGTWASIGKMLPDLNLIFRYHNTQGTGSMQPENEYFGGLVLSWNIWEWGASYYDMRSSQALEAKTEAAIAAGEDMIRLEVRSKWLELQASEKSLVVTGMQVEQAQENLRIVQLRYDAAEATTTELLDAQTMLLKAQNEQIVAEVNQRAATYALMIARGKDLVKNK